MKHIEANDPDVHRLILREEERQACSLTLIASENHSSKAVREAMASHLTDKYAEGYPGRRYYGGCEVGDDVERLARDRAKELFGAGYANVQPHSGTQANIAAYLAMMQPGDRLLGMALNAGGHLSHGFSRSHTGQLFEAASYGLDESTGLIDYAALEKLAQEHEPKVIVAGGSAYPRLVDWQRIRAIADAVGAKLMADIAHPAGLIAGGLIPSPVGIAHVVTMTTHKTLRGPRGGMILTNEDDLKQPLNSSVFPGGQGGPFLNAIAAKAIAFGEALQPAFKDWGRQVIANAQALGVALVERGLDLVTGGTDTHLVLVDLRAKDMSGRDAEELCLQANLVVNKNLIPGDPRKAMETSGLRLGTPAVTTRGMKEDHMVELADAIDRLLTGGESEVAGVREKISALASDLPLP
ncbi:MAG: serine hydroxymethyltransferase [Planctomycetota bacterium]|jgi:glycine hydroxymethyltransferase|nr:serine hydroxymethyltransferase [Planctomycetota bacterium]